MKNLKKITLAAAVLLVAACATTAPTLSYRPANHTGPAWSITAKADNGVVRDTIRIMINNEVAVTGSLHSLKLKDTFTGTYQGKTVSAECEAKPAVGGLTMEHVCQVFIDNERAAQLTF